MTISPEFSDFHAPFIITAHNTSKVLHKTDNWPVLARRRQGSSVCMASVFQPILHRHSVQHPVQDLPCYKGNMVKVRRFVQRPFVRTSLLKSWGMDHTVFTLLTHHICLYLVCVHHLIAAYYSFIDPARMKGSVGLVSWPTVDSLPI